MSAKALRSRFQPSQPVAFHVTREEYERLEAEFRAGAARSLPELIRGKILRSIATLPLVDISRNLDKLERALHELSEALEKTGASHGR